MKIARIDLSNLFFDWQKNKKSTVNVTASKIAFLNGVQNIVSEFGDYEVKEELGYNFNKDWQIDLEKNGKLENRIRDFYDSGTWIVRK